MSLTKKIQSQAKGLKQAIKAGTSNAKRLPNQIHLPSLAFYFPIKSMGNAK